MDTSSNNTNTERTGKIQTYGAILFAVLIAVIGALMMTITSSPQMKGAAFLWIPAALQLVAGVWFGPKKGLLAGGLGAYLAGIFAYGGWGIVDIIMNPIAGGIANSLLPAILFRVFKINPDFGGNSEELKKGFFVIISLLVIVVFIGLLPLFTAIGNWAYVIAAVLLLGGSRIFLSNIHIRRKDFVLAVLISIVISGISALIGTLGVVIGGNTFMAALIGTGLGWWLGDTVSCFLGIYILAYFTPRARAKGLFKDYSYG